MHKWPLKSIVPSGNAISSLVATVPSVLPPIDDVFFAERMCSSQVEREKVGEESHHRHGHLDSEHTCSAHLRVHLYMSGRILRCL